MARRVVCIVQARMGSTRLPGKALASLAGRPMTERIIERLKRSKRIDALVLAIPEGPADEPLARLGSDCGVAVFRGPQDDLLERYRLAALEHRADVVVRHPADNPVVEPAEVDRIIDYHLKGTSDFSSNLYEIQGSGYPDGLGAEAFDLARLEEACREAKDPRNREHPHTFFYDHPERFRIGTIPCPAEFARPDLRLDVNTREDLRYIAALYDALYPANHEFHITDIIRWHDGVWLRAQGAR